MAYVIAGVVLVVIAGTVVWWQSQTTPTPAAEVTETETIPTPPAPPAATPTQAPVPDQNEIDPDITPEVSDAPSELEPVVIAEDTPTNQSPYQDGRYTTQASYFTPRRTEHEMSITLTLNDGIVTDATILYDNAAPVTPQHKNFDTAYKEAVIGKPLDSIALSRVGGASLTTNSFNEAVAAIKVDAAS